MDIYAIWEGLLTDPLLEQVMVDPEDFTEFESLWQAGFFQELLD